MSLVYLPAPPGARDAGRIRELELVRSRVAEIARDLDLRLLDVGVVFARDTNARAVWWSPRTHYSPYGNRVLANAVIEFLRQNEEPTVK